MFKKIAACRICGNTNLKLILDLGEQSLTGVFPKSKADRLTTGPLALVKCYSESGKEHCGLIQLAHAYDHSEMYGMNYGYRSGLNASMVRHLKGIQQKIVSRNILENGDLIVDIGSNDGTMLNFYPSDKGYLLTGIDPTGIKFKKYYPSHIELIPDFFAASLLREKFGSKKAKVITSIAMFYDLEDPSQFVRDISECLSEEGIWIFEQSYIVLMLETNGYDTVCHEHSEYYSMKQIKWLLEKNGMRIADVELNDVNGGSFQVTAVKKNSPIISNEDHIHNLEAEEKRLMLDKLEPYRIFSEKVEKHRDDLRALIRDLNKQGKKVFGYGASTKGNVMLQYCGFTSADIPFIAEVNEDKFGAFTPATLIPIISEKEARARKPDYFLLLPWHFRKGILEKEKQFLSDGGLFILPLPEIQILHG